MANSRQPNDSTDSWQHAETRTIVLVGLMGAGKTAVGRVLADRLHLPFVDADREIEAAAGLTINEIFARHGEPFFREREEKVMARLLSGPPKVLAAGGGAFMSAATRERIRASALSIWLKAEIDLLVKRTAKRNHRPLLAGENTRSVLERLAAEREPIYASADIVVETSDEAAEAVAARVAASLAEHLSPHRGERAGVRATMREVIVPVELGDRSYEVRIGSGVLDRAGDILAARLRRKDIVVVTDATVAGLHLTRLERALKKTGFRSRTIVLSPGEGTKDFAHLERLLDDLLDGGLERTTTVVALGGGVIGDIAGFAAAIALRGLDYVQMPTTLLAQVDSSVGGKTAIDTPHGKNLVGAFHQPRLVLADIGTLSTLPRRQILAGYAEVAKYGLINDPAFFAWLDEHGAALVNGDEALRLEAVGTSVRAKAAIVSRDERETGDRALLNLGHTFAHALEADVGFGAELLHGEAVAAGICLAFALSARLGLCPVADSLRVRRHFEKVGLQTRLKGWLGRAWNPDALLGHMRHDKKVRDRTIRFVLTRGIGKAFVSEGVDADAVLAMLSDEIAA